MRKIKLKKEEAKRLSILLKNEIAEKEKQWQNVKGQSFKYEERRSEILNKQGDDIDFLKVIKEKIDSEIFLNG